MASRTTVCPSCQEAVPSGRLSCPSCGVLLASVAGAPSPRRTRKPPAAEPADAVAPVESAPKPAGAYVPPTASSGPFLLPARAWAGITSASPRPMAGLGLGARPMATAGGAVASMSGASAGGILVKVPTRPPAAPAARLPAVTPAPQPGPTTATAAAHGVTDEADEGDAVEAGWLEAAAGWLMIIGSAVAILGFLLPWSRSVIGSTGVGSYFDTWGIANPSHVLVVLALAAALGLAIVANPIPTWIRTCAVGLALGGLLLGLTWPYLFGPLGAGPGVLAILVGGVMLAIAGILDLVEARHGPADPLV